MLAALNLGDVTTPAGFAALIQVLIVDLVLAGDNAVIVGSLASPFPPRERRQVIAIGIGAALAMRIVFALIASRLIHVIGLLFAGGLLLLWVAWKFWRELRSDAGGAHGAVKPRKTLMGAAWSLALADVSMSLDNVLGVVGAAKDHPTVLVMGLILSVVLMGLAANLVARLIERHRWIAYGGLAVILFIAVKMIWHGIVEPQTGILHLFTGGATA